jgi:tRNA dimethylallyltransferase
MKTLFVLLGPTGVGKTALSISLADFLRSPVINADSRQIYRDIPIGTAAPTAGEQARARHYFVGTLPLQQYYSAAQYEADVMALTGELFRSHNNLLLTGGSMMYIDAICQGIDDIPTVTPETRSRLRRQWEEQGLEAMAEQLKALDPDYWATVDRHNPRRVVHALEICVQTGRPYSSFLRRQPKKRPFRIVKIGLLRPREQLFQRIHDRVQAMLAQGLEEEARRVYPLRHCNALQTVGYREMFQYFDGTWSREEAIAKIERNTRVYAKKQHTWFSRDGSVFWFDASHACAVLNFVRDMVKLETPCAH